MKFRRLLMPMIVLGIMFTMSSMVFGQANVTCSLANATNANVPAANVPAAPAAAPAGAAVPITPVFSENGILLQGPSANGASTGHTEVPSAGSGAIPSATNTLGAPTQGGQTIRVACYNNGSPATTPGVIILTVNFGVPITNNQTFPSVGAGIRVTNGTGAFVTTVPNCLTASACAGANVGIGAVANSTGQIVIGLGTPVAVSSTIAPQNPNTGITFASGAGSVSTFDLQGVLLSTNGKSGEIDATLTEQSGNVNIGVGSIAVITNVQAPLGNPSIPSTLGSAAATAFGLAASAGGPAVLNNNGQGGKNSFVIKVTENYSDLFKSSAQFNGGAVFPAGGGSSTQVNFIFKNVPSGLTISGCSAVLTDSTGALVEPGSPGVSATNVTATAPILTVTMTAPTDVTTQTSLWLGCTNVAVGSATLPLPSTSVTVQVEMAPLGAALSSLGGALTALNTGLIPRYQDTPIPATAITVILFPPSSTTLLITYAVVVPGFNTGIAIANTTTDPFGTANGGASPTAGTVLFTMYPNAGGSPLTFTSPSVASGTVFANNLSSMLPSGTTSFSGYIFAQTNFPNGHGAATIYDTNTGHAALSTPVLVVLSPGVNGNGISSANGRSTGESLAQ